jgi:type VI secretion system VgrG family protein
LSDDHQLLRELAAELGLPTLPALHTGQRLYHLHTRSPRAAPVVAQLLVEAWAMHEALSALYELQLCCVSLDPRLDLDALLAQPLRLRTTLADGRFAWRSGIVRAAERLQADGGLARYRLSLVPWPWLLTQRQHSAVWQQRSVVQITDELLAAVQPVSWQWTPEVSGFLAQGPHAGVHPFVAQHRESDFAFLARRWAEEGLGFRFEEDDDGALQHRLVLFADSQANPEDPSSAADGGLRFHRASSAEQQDAVQAFGAEHNFLCSVSTVLSWDHRHKRAVAASVPGLQVPGGPDAPVLEHYDVPGFDTYPDHASAQHAAQLHREAVECRRQRQLGRSTVRTLRAGSLFSLRGSPLDLLPETPRFLLTEVHHAGLNNLPKELGHALAKRLGEPAAELLTLALEPEVLQQAQASGYGNSFVAQPANLPFRAQRCPKPEHPGAQSAIVVGAQGQSQPQGADQIHCDALGRIRVRFHWQRGERADDRNTCWLRVAQPYAGARMGAQFLPRIGQEVLVDFLEGDIDRPIVLRALYNGRGEGGIPATPGGQEGSSERSVFQRSSDHRPSGQGNLTGGNAPAWHGAATAEQRNRAALSGIKTQEFGGPGYNQLVFDDSDGQLRTQFGTTQHATWLNLGHLIHQADNHRGSFRGVGFELRTDAWGAVRAKSGLLISTYATDPGAPAGDNAPVQALVQQMLQLAQTFNQAARTHQTVQLAGVVGSTAAGASGLSGTEAPLKALMTTLYGQVAAEVFEAAGADASRRNTQGADKLPHTTDPVITLAARAGLVATAGQDVVLAANDTIHLGAGQDSTRAIGGAARLHTGQAIGVLAGATRPGEEAAGSGITMVAGRGDVQVQAQAGPLQIAAKGLVNVQSAHGHIDWAAAKKITLQTAGGASIVIEAGGITVQCPGKITVHAATKSFVGAQGEDYAMPLMPRGELKLAACFPFSL